MADLGAIGYERGIAVYRRRLWWGTLRIAGTTKVNGVAAARKVRLYRRSSGELVDEVWSAANGAYEFPNLAAGEYLVVALDHINTYNAAVADIVEAVT